MSNGQVNLARRWRSKTFDEIIGQDLVVRLAKNSLYRGQLFPVYLLSGQRGCGKTTMGRVFAAAVNCERLAEFQQQPQSVMLPCLSCSSCNAMAAGKHPDFIEIDAASHTGVDNVRGLIESAAYLPVLGRKKIYLIDEAHMLSKAAFNAFLKILEEPPHTALFMLATTDVHKIIDTVRSRCFQLFFQPVSQQTLLNHLEHLCAKEQIAYTIDGLAVVVQETEGSVRDAINLIERVRLAHDAVTQTSVSTMLGAVHDEQLVEVLSFICKGKSAHVISEAQRWQQQGYQARIVWRRLIELIRSCLLVYHNQELGPHESFSLYQKKIKEIIGSLEAITLIRLWELCYEVESVMLKTTVQHGILELLLLQMCALSGQVSSTSSSKPSSNLSDNKSTPLPMPPSTESLSKDTSLWGAFLASVETLNDPLVYSMFKQAKLVEWDEGGNVEVAFPAKFVFFKEMLATTEHVWKAAMQKVAGCSITFVPQFQATEESGTPSLPPKQSFGSKERQPITRPLPPQKKTADKVIAIQDEASYPQAHLLLKAFPGTLYEKQDMTL